MRFRVITSPPLPPAKAWFSVPDTVQRTLTIAGLKCDLCSQIPALQHEAITGDELRLAIDDFDLLDSAEVDVIRENDLVSISKCDTVTSRARKRKADTQSPLPRKRHRLSPAHVSRASPSRKVSALKRSADSENDSTSDETSSSDSSSQSSSSASSTSASDSSESSSGSSMILLGKRSARKAANGAAPAKPETNRPPPLVPPGMGKTSTHSRNVRRRIKRLAERNQTLARPGQAAAVASSSANSVPLGERSNGLEPHTPDAPAAAATQSPATQTLAEHSLTMFSSLRNKNKKHGFKRAMMNVTAQRIVFDPSPSAPSAASVQAPHGSPAGDDVAAPGQWRPRRLTPPSEKEARGELPPHVFVTSVELEDGAWDRKRKRRQRDAYGFEDEVSVGPAAADPSLDGIVLDYGAAEGTGEASTSADIDWTAAEKNWDAFAAVADVASLKVDVVVGWKALAINPATFTPEVLLSLARVISIALEDSTIVVRPFLRPGTGQISFGGAADDDAAEDDAVVEESFAFADVLAADWKVVLL